MSFKGATPSLYDVHVVNEEASMFKGLEIGISQGEDDDEKSTKKKKKKKEKREKHEKHVTDNEESTVGDVSIATDNTDTGTEATEADKKKKKEKKEAKLAKKEAKKQAKLKRSLWLEFPDWERKVDESRTVYYVHEMSGVTTWLAPCCKCGNTSETFCLECGKAFCLADYDEYHGGENFEDNERDLHICSEFEPYSAMFTRAELNPDEEYCIECQLQAAQKVCTDCWDSYCLECFKNVHNVGALRYHKVVPYGRAKMGWHVIKYHGTNKPDLYVNGVTDEQTTEPPEELLSELEIVYRDSYTMFEEARLQNTKIIENLTKEIEKAKVDRDIVLMNKMKRQK